MLYLIDYERQTGLVRSIKNYVDSSRREAEEARLTLELKLRNEGIEREVVLLQAENMAALRKTHARYFEKWMELANSAAG